MPNIPLSHSNFPLSGWADQQLCTLAHDTGSQNIASLSGIGLLNERLTPPQPSCKFYRAHDDHIALNLSRAEDRALLPALFCADLNPYDETEIAHHIRQSLTFPLVARAREMGLAVAALHEIPPRRAHSVIAHGPQRHIAPPTKPLALDLTSLWAGPLSAHLLMLAGTEVIRVENPNRPDTMRIGDPQLYTLLNQGKASVTLDPRRADDRRALLSLIARADIILESARPRALYQLGIDASALIKAKSGQIWINITAHGASGDAANWVGFGDDCAVAGGLSAALLQTTGKRGFVGNAIGDPLTGIYAAKIAWRAFQRGKSARMGISISGVVAKALRESEASITAELVAWAQSHTSHLSNEVETYSAQRSQTLPLRSLGADNARYLSC